MVSRRVLLALEASALRNRPRVHWPPFASLAVEQPQRRAPWTPSHRGEPHVVLTHAIDSSCRLHPFPAPSLPVSAIPCLCPANFLKLVCARVPYPVATNSTLPARCARHSCGTRGLRGHASAACLWRPPGDIISRWHDHVVRELNPEHPGI